MPIADWSTSPKDRWLMFAGVGGAACLYGIIHFIQGEWLLGLAKTGVFLLVSYGFVFGLIPRVEHWIHHGFESREQEADSERRSA